MKVQEDYTKALLWAQGIILVFYFVRRLPLFFDALLIPRVRSSRLSCTDSPVNTSLPPRSDPQEFSSPSTFLLVIIFNSQSPHTPQPLTSYRIAEYVTDSLFPLSSSQQSSTSIFRRNIFSFDCSESRSI